MNNRTNVNHPLRLPEETFFFIVREPYKPREMRLDASRESTPLKMTYWFFCFVLLT